MLIPVDNINRADRIRAVNPVTVSALAASIREVGLLNPITVSVTTVVRNAKAQDGYILIGGLHRLEAAKSLGWAEIEATITELSGPAAVIAECDENLCGTNLSKAERALFTARRKEAYEALHPETKNGGDRGNQYIGGKVADCQVGELPAAERFTLDTAKKTGQSERAVQRDASRGERVAPEVLSQIAGTKLDTGKTLDELAALPKEQQSIRVAEIVERKAVKPVPPPREPYNDIEATNKQVDAIMRAWNAAGREAREIARDMMDAIPVFDNTRAA